MFRTLLLATVAGTGVNAANVPAASELNARGNTPESYLCSSVKQKCAQAKQRDSVTAYCSSYLSIPESKTTKVYTVWKKTTTTTTSYTSTATATASTTTSTITSCAPPTITTVPEAPEDNGGEESGGEESNTPPGRRDLSKKLKKRGWPAKKPTCLPEGKQSVSEACKCLSIKPCTKTVFSATTETYTRTKVVKTVTTQTPTPVTKYTLDPTGVLVGNDRGFFLNEECYTPKVIKSGQGSGTGSLEFSAETAAILFELNSAGNLAALEGTFAGGLAAEKADGSSYVVDIVDESQIEDNTFVPLVCSVSQPADGTCPLVCQARAGDVSQGSGLGDWILGPPNSVSDSSTYKTFAVTRSQRGGRGGCGMTSGGDRRRKR